MTPQQAAILAFTKQLERIETAVIGNDGLGLLSRTARIEEKVDSVESFAKDTKILAVDASEKSEKSISLLAESLNELTKSVIRLEDSVDTHVNTEHLSELMKKKSFWILLATGFVVLHEFATVLQIGIPTLWQLILKL